VAGIICPHDDYLIAGRVYREIIPLVTAKVVVMVGVFHRYRRYGVRNVMVFDPYRAWRSPDGEIRVAELRDALLARLDPGDFVQAPALHDSEHSLEGIAYCLKHQDPEVEILPVVLPSAPFPRLRAMAERFGVELASLMKARGWVLGRDVAVVISSDGIHYGNDFNYAPYGEGGVGPFQAAMDHDRRVLRELLAGKVTPAMAQEFYETMVDPDHPDTYRKTWCGRFSIPFGLLLLEAASRELEQAPLRGLPVAFGASVDVPELPVRNIGLGPTCPISLYHFVTFPAAAFVS
ncbi:MAG TPA: AmmeMemoRadiSam system protein B, partial [Holophaga sp.]|nr:AmmeMemoRadiSam system protein B [Holophaga sp.]